MSNADFVERYYECIATDPDYRARLIADPVGVVCEEFGYTPGPDFKIEIIEQAEDTIVIMVPPKPEAGQDTEQALDSASLPVRTPRQSIGIECSSREGIAHGP